VHPGLLLSESSPLPPSVTAPAHTAAVAGVSAEGTIVRTIVGLAIVLGVIYGLYWLLRSHARARGGGTDERIAVVASTGLGQNRTLHLVRCGDELLLVGSAEGGISRLGSYPAELADEPPDLPLTPLAPAGTLLERLRGLTERR
jgi:flagellar protein FliO/FliZ